MKLVVYRFDSRVYLSLIVVSSNVKELNQW